MNLCFLKGKIISKIEFDFIINSKDYAIAKFKLQLDEKTTLTIKGYNKIADYCYCKLKINDIIIIQGSIETNSEIKIESIQLI